MPILSVENISFQYPDTKREAGFNNINLSLNKKETLAIVGESGSGKSTLLNSLACLINLQSGSIFINGEPLKGPKEVLIPGNKNIALVSQTFSLDPYASVLDIITKPIQRLEEHAQKQIIFEISEILKITEILKEKAVNLSGGQQKRVALAKALVNIPSVLLLDEPFVGLDAQTSFSLFNYLLNRQIVEGFAMIFASHNPTEISHFSSKCLVLKQGEPIFFGSTNTIIKKPNSLYIAGLMGPIIKLNNQFGKINQLEFNENLNGLFSIISSKLTDENLYYVTAKNENNKLVNFYSSILLKKGLKGNISFNKVLQFGA